MFKMFEAISAAIPSLASCASVMLQLSNVLLRLALRPDLRLRPRLGETSRIPVTNFCVPPARNNGRESPLQVWNDHRNKSYAVPSILDEVYEQKELLRWREHDPEIVLQCAVCHRGWAHLGSLIIKVCIRTGDWGSAAQTIDKERWCKYKSSNRPTVPRLHASHACVIG